LVFPIRRCSFLFPFRISSLACTKKHYSALKKDKFEKASELQKKRNQLLEKHQREEIRQEEERQYAEKKNLHLALNHIKEQNQNHWQTQWNRFLEWKREKVSQLDLRQCEARESFERDTMARMLSQPTRYSTQVHDWVRAKNQLKQLHKYSECEILAKKLNLKKQQEEAAFQFQQRATIDQRRRRLLKKQEGERSFLMGKLKLLQQKLLIQKESDERNLEQRFSNLLADAEHAFHMEFLSQREVNAPVQSRRSLENTSATFLGSLLQKKLRGGQQYSVPALCDLYGDEL